MVELRPIDYVAAAIVYRLVDQPVLRSKPQSLQSIKRSCDGFFKVKLPIAAYRYAVRTLAQAELIDHSNSEYDVPDLTVGPDFETRVAKWRIIDGVDAAAVVLDQYMNGQPDWMSGVLSDANFRASLHEQLRELETRASEAISSTSWTGLAGRYKVSASTHKRINERLSELSLLVESLDISQSEKSQVGAALAASVILSEAPEPPWQTIIILLSAAAAVAAISSGVIDIIHLITLG